MPIQPSAENAEALLANIEKEIEEINPATKNFSPPNSYFQRKPKILSLLENLKLDEELSRVAREQDICLFSYFSLNSFQNVPPPSWDITIIDEIMALDLTHAAWSSFSQSLLSKPTILISSFKNSSTTKEVKMIAGTPHFLTLDWGNHDDLSSKQNAFNPKLMSSIIEFWNSVDQQKSQLNLNSNLS